MISVLQLLLDCWKSQVLEDRREHVLDINSAQGDGGRALVGDDPIVDTMKELDELLGVSEPPF